MNKKYSELAELFRSEKTDEEILDFLLNYHKEKNSSAAHFGRRSLCFSQKGGSIFDSHNCKRNQGIQMGFYRHAAVYAAGSPDGDPDSVPHGLDHRQGCQCR